VQIHRSSYLNKKPNPVRPVRRAPVTYRQKQLLMAVLLKNAAVFRSVSARLQSTHFREREDRAFVVVYNVLRELFAQSGDIPTIEILSTEISARLEDDPELLSGEQIDDVDTLLKIAGSIEVGTQERKAALGYAKRLMEEALHIELHSRADSSAGFSDLPTLLTEVRAQIESIAALDAGQTQPFFPANPADMLPTVVESTGIVWLDTYMNGGQASKEVYGFLGPYGSCKTTLSVMLCVNRARSDQHKYGRDAVLPLIYLVAWEEEREQLQFRGMSYAARIHKDSLSGAEWYSGLSTTGNYKEYEEKLFLPFFQGRTLPGEKERLHVAIEELNKNMVNLDFTGADRNYRDLSCSMVTGVAAAIEADQAARGNPGVSLVVLDYAGAAAKRLLARSGQDADRALRHLIGGMPLSAKSELAIPFDCPVWIMHQTGTEAQSKAPGSIPKATDAAEGRNFLENLNFGFLIGTVSTDNTCVLVAGKQRRAARSVPKVLKISGEFATVSDVSKQYRIANNAIMEHRSADEIIDEDEAADTKQQALSLPPVVFDTLFKDLTNGAKLRAVPSSAETVRKRKRESAP